MLQPRPRREEDHHDNEESVVGLGLQDALNPPPEYTSPESSDAGGDSRRNSTESENTPLIEVVNRSRQTSSAAPAAPPRCRSTRPYRATRTRYGRVPPGNAAIAARQLGRAGSRAHDPKSCEKEKKKGNCTCC